MHSINPAIAGFWHYKTLVMQKQLIVCHFNGVRIEQIYTNVPKTDKWAKQTVRLHNADIVANGGQLESEFWFLEEKIKSRSVIITLAPDGDFIKDDPDILNRLGLDKQAQTKPGSAQNRGKEGDFNKRRDNA